MDRTEWLEARRKGIGSSDAAAVCGMSDFNITPLHVYLDKLGVLPPREGAQLDWGHWLEDDIAHAYGVATGREVHPPDFPIMAHIRYPWMLASLDRVSNGEEGKRILECKASRSRDGWGPPGTDVVPTGYNIQVQHQLAVAGLEWADIAVLWGVGDFAIYHIRADPLFANSLIQIEEAFWNKVVNRDPPEPDWKHPDTPKLLNLLNPPEDGCSIDLDTEEEMLVNEYQILGEEVIRLANRRQEIKAHLLAFMGLAGEAHLADGRRVKRNCYERKGFTVEPATVFDFRILGPKKGKR